MPAYNRRSRSRVVLMCRDSSEELRVELKVGDTTRLSRAPRRFPSMTYKRQYSRAMASFVVAHTLSRFFALARMISARLLSAAEE